MERHPERIDGVVRADGSVTPLNAGDVVAAAVDVCRDTGIPLAPQVKARLGRSAKALLEAEFPPTTVVSACVVAIRTGWYGSVETIAQEMVVAQAGQRITREDFRRALDQTSHKIRTADTPIWEALRKGFGKGVTG
jgi:hypothetical protein